MLLAGQTYTNTTTKSYFWKNYNKYLHVPTVANSGGTITDTVATQAYARSYGGGGDVAALTTRIDSLVNAIYELTIRNDSLVTVLSDTTDLQTAFSEIVPIIQNMTAAEISAISSPVDGMMIYDETNDVFVIRRNSTWVKLSYTSWP